MEGLGAGLAVFSFWGFIAAVVVAGIWYGLRERQAQYDTLSRVIESGQQIDDELVDRILGSNKNPDRDLKIAGYITLSAAPGLAILGWFLSLMEDRVIYPLLGVAGLAACVGVGLLVAARVAARAKKNDAAASPYSTTAP